MTYLRPLFGSIRNGLHFFIWPKRADSPATGQGHYRQKPERALIFIYLNDVQGKIGNFTDVGLNQKNEYDIKARV